MIYRIVIIVTTHDPNDAVVPVSGRVVMTFGIRAVPVTLFEEVIKECQEAIDTISLNILYSNLFYKLPIY